MLSGTQNLSHFVSFRFRRSVATATFCCVRVNERQFPLKLRISLCVLFVFGVGVWTSLPLVSAIAQDPQGAVGLASAFALGAAIAGSVGAPLAGSLTSAARPGLAVTLMQF